MHSARDRSSLLSAGAASGAFSRSWHHAYFVWLDQYADSADAHPGAAASTLRSSALIGLLDETGTGYELLPLVPEVLSLGRFRHDANGYPRASVQDGDLLWTWKNWDAALGVADWLGVLR